MVAPTVDHDELITRLTSASNNSRQQADVFDALITAVKANSKSSTILLAVSNALDGVKSAKRKAAEDDSDEGDDSKKRKRRAKKDPNAPKRPASAYILYQNHVRPELKENFPNLTHKEILVKVAESWGKMTDAEKKPYYDTHAAAKVKHDADKVEYEKNPIPFDPKAPTVKKPRTKKVAAPVANAESSDEEEASAEEDSDIPVAAVAATSDTSDEEEDDEEEEELPPPKKKKTTAPPSKEVKKSKKSKA